MQFTLNLDVPPFEAPIKYTDKIMLIGSCFTEHISGRLEQHKFKVLSNPHGILFNPFSVAASLDAYISAKNYNESELFYLNELWNSWDHHTRFSGTDINSVLSHINQSQNESASFIKDTDWLIITLGSSFQYFLKENGKHVANNHRAPAQWFEKKMLGIDEITAGFKATLDRLVTLNPKIKIIFTISPVRHIRDGVVDNNRSKARLIESVHELCSCFNNVFYFPAYELVIDILRDYRFYDIDFVHPNYMATSYVWEQFVGALITPTDQEIMKQVQEITTSRAHRPRFPDTMAHKKFMDNNLNKIKGLLTKYPFLDLSEEADYFGCNS